MVAAVLDKERDSSEEQRVRRQKRALVAGLEWKEYAEVELDARVLNEWAAKMFKQCVWYKNKLDR